MRGQEDLILAERFGERCIAHGPRGRLDAAVAADVHPAHLAGDAEAFAYAQGMARPVVGIPMQGVVHVQRPHPPIVERG